jgi:trk system potassium uptake protein TrkA
MRVVIVGLGNVGGFLADDLRSSGHDVTVVERHPELVAAAAAAQPAIRWIAGDGCEVATLEEAGAGEAAVVVATTGDDEDNLVISLLAKQEFAVPRVVARVNHPKNEWMFNESWGVDVAVSTPHLLSALVAEAVNVGSLVRLLQLDASGVRLVEVTLTDRSPATGQTIAGLEMPRNSSVVAIVRRASVIVPRGDSRMEAGDEVLALVGPDSEERVREILAGSPPKTISPALTPLP